MNEFIVWDEKKKMFYDVIEVNYENFDNTLRYVKGNNGKRLYVGHDDFTIFNYIDKTDIEGNKIYADCSIVEFKVEICKSLVTRKGYFSSNNELGLLEIKAFSLSTGKPDKERFNLVEFSIENLKVIGTLQENPELMEK